MKLRFFAAFGLAAVAPLLSGFSAGSSFETSADVGGGGGYTFVGSSTSHGLDCASCHQSNSTSGRLSLASNPPGLFDRGYVPGTSYLIAVRLAQEVKGLERNGACEAEQGGCNRNGFVAEFLGQNGQPIGQLCTDNGVLSDQGCDNDAGQETTLFSGARAVSGVSLEQPTICGSSAGQDPPGCVDVAALQAAGKSQSEIDKILVSAVKGRTSWHFRWQAPQNGTPVAFHLGAVDGDGGIGTSPNLNDYNGDVVYAVHRAVPVEGAAVEEAASCGAAGPRPIGGWSAVLAAVSLTLSARRWSKKRRDRNDV